MYYIGRMYLIMTANDLYWQYESKTSIPSPSSHLSMPGLPTFVSVLGQEVQADWRHHLAGALGGFWDGLGGGCGGCGGGVDCGGGCDGDGGCGGAYGYGGLSYDYC